MAIFNPFRALKQAVTPSYLGLDIGTTSIKMVEVAKKAERPIILNYGMLENRGSLQRINTAIQTSSLKISEKETSELLRVLVARMKPKTTNVIASVPVFSSFTALLSFPQMAPKDLEKAIQFQARQYIPLPLEEVALDWLKVGEYQDEKGFGYVQILLISVPQEQIAKYRSLCAAAGLSLQSLEVESLSLTRMLIGHDPTPSYIIDIGARSTNILIAEQGTLRFAGQTDFSSSSLTQALASSLSINPFRAEELKKERGIAGTGPNYELSTIMMPFLDAILNEVKRVDFSYRSQFSGAKPIERAILTGGGANLLGIQKYAQNELGIPTVKASPFLSFDYPSSLEPLVPELNPLFSVALGLAIRDFSS